MLGYVSNTTPNHYFHYALLNPDLVECDLALVRLRRNQEEVFKLHALGRRARCEFDPLHLPEHKRHDVPQLHASEVDTNA